MVILHNAIKTIQNGVFVFFWKKNKNLFLSKNPNKKKQEGWNFFKKRIFLNPDYLSTLFVIFPWSPDLEQLTSLSVWLAVRRTPRVKDPGNEEAENYWHSNT